MTTEKRNTVILVAPSEGKKEGGKMFDEHPSTFLHSQKPLYIAIHATHKDLKCIGSRYEQGIALNTAVEESALLPAIERYTGIQYKEIGYESLSMDAQQFIQEHVLICSGMYGLLRPLDLIANYKLPIETKGLLSHWKQVITTALQESGYETIINLLPGSYANMVDRKKIEAEVISPMFFKRENGQKKKLTHMVKKYRGQRLRECARAQKVSKKREIIQNE